MPKKYIYEFVKKEIEKRGGVLLSKEYISANRPLRVKCNIHKRIWNPRFHNILNSQWCPECAKEKKRKKLMFTYEFVKQTIENLGAILVSKEYLGSGIPIDLICSKGHDCCARFADILRGKWCMQCGSSLKGIKRLHQSYTKLLKILKEKKGLLLSEYKGNWKKLQIQCHNGHVFERTLQELQHNHWCKQCIDDQHISDLNNKIQLNNGTLLTKYEGYSKYIKVQCNVCQNIWKIRPCDIMFGYWCLNCSKYKTQRKITELIKQIFPDCVVYSNFKKFDWLYNQKTNGRQELDIFVPKLKLAIEYNGQQHYMPKSFGNQTQKQAEQELKMTKKRDRRKLKKIKQHPEDIKFFIIFKYTEQKKITKEYVIKKLKQYKVPLGIIEI